MACLTPQVGSGGSLYAPYTLLQWRGGAEGYLTNNLVSRGPEYIGQCTPMEVRAATIEQALLTHTGATDWGSC